MPFFGELYGVADQVDQDLPHPNRIGANGLRNQSGEFHEQRQSLGVGADFHHRNHVFNQLARRTLGLFRHEMSGFDFGEIENVVDDAEQIFAVALDGIGGNDVLGPLDAFQQHFREA